MLLQIRGAHCLAAAPLMGGLPPSSPGAAQVTPQAGGGCRVQHRLSVQPSLAPPEALASYTKKIFVRQVERLLEDLSRELCRVQAHSS